MTGVQTCALPISIFDVDRDRAYVARFSEEGTVNPPGPGEETCTITYAADPAEGGSITAVSGDVTGANGRITVAKDADVTLTAVANAEYNFAGWYDASGEKAGEEAVLTVAKVTADASYTARFESDNPDNPQPSVKYTIRYAADPAEGGTVTAKASDVTGVNGAIQVEKDGSVTLTLSPAKNPKKGLDGVNAEGSVRNGTETFLGYKLAGGSADSVCLVLYSHQGGLEMLNELHLTLCQAAALLFAESGGTFFKHFECGRRIGHIIAFGIVYACLQKLIIGLSFGKFFKNQLFEFLKFFIGISGLFSHGA